MFNFLIDNLKVKRLKKRKMAKCIICEQLTNDLLHKCEIEDCVKHIHDKCLQPGEAARKEDIVLWRCQDHQNRLEDEGDSDSSVETVHSSPTLNTTVELNPHNQSNELLGLIDTIQKKTRAPPTNATGGSGPARRNPVVLCTICKGSLEYEFLKISCVSCKKQFHRRCLIEQAGIEVEACQNFITCDPCAALQLSKRRTPTPEAQIPEATRAQENQRPAVPQSYNMPPPPPPKQRLSYQNEMRTQASHEFYPEQQAQFPTFNPLPRRADQNEPIQQFPHFEPQARRIPNPEAGYYARQLNGTSNRGIPRYSSRPTRRVTYQDEYSDDNYHRPQYNNFTQQYYSDDGYSRPRPSVFAPPLGGRSTGYGPNFPLSGNGPRFGQYSPNNTLNLSANDSFAIMIQKEANRELPICTDSKRTFLALYDTYQQTRHLFSPVENLNRITKAIKSADVLELGGSYLSQLDYFEGKLDRINEEYRRVDIVDEDYRTLISGEPIAERDLKGIVTYLRDLISLLDITIKTEGPNCHSGNTKIRTLLRRLPSTVKDKFDKDFVAKTDLDGRVITMNGGSLRESVIKIQNLYSVKLARLECEKADTMLTKSKDHKSYNTVISTEEDKPNKRCWFHNTQNHPASKCSYLWGLSGTIAIAEADKKGRCIECGFRKHFDDRCPIIKNLTCNIKGCSDKHYSMFCPKRTPRAKKINNHHTNDEIVDSDIAELMEAAQLEATEDYEEVAEELTPSQVESINLSHNMTYKKPSGNFLGVVVMKAGEHQINIMLDKGSTCSLIDADFANLLLKLGSRGQQLSMKWTGGVGRSDEESKIIKVRLSKMSNALENHIMYFRTFKNLGIHPQPFNANEFKKYDHLKHLNLYNYDKIHALVGVETMKWFLNTQCFAAKNFPERYPVGYRCTYGDYILLAEKQLEEVYEKLADNNEASVHYTYNIAMLNENEIEEFDKMEKVALNQLEKFSSVNNDRENFDDTVALKKLQEEVRQLPNSKHFEAPLLWKDENKLMLPTYESKKLALKRAHILETVLIRRNIHEICEDEIKKLLDKGYARRLLPYEINKVSNKTYYVSIFFIFQKRVRMIWDLAAKVLGRSLNEEMLSGPDNYNCLLNILCKAREKQILVIGDISEMFHQIYLKKTDSDCMRFLFKFLNEPEVTEMIMERFPFGAICSPSVANFVKELIAKTFKEKFPEASDAVLNCSYVDDTVKSVDSEEEGLKLLTDIRSLYEEGGFDFVKMNSNSSSLNKKLLEHYEKRRESKDKLVVNERTCKILGYVFNLEADTMSINSLENKFPKEFLEGIAIPTKHKVLSYLMSIYDPLGLCEYMKAGLKLMYRKISSPDTKWEDKIPETLIGEWQESLKRLNKISDIQIPRLLCLGEFHEVELHGFGDAGQHMLCTVLYAKFIDEEGLTIDVRIIFSKSYVVPIKKERSIPELELDTSSKLVELSAKVEKMHSLEFKRSVFYTDSTCVYYLIHRLDGRKDSIYTRNRLNKIHLHSKPENWCWIKTEDQPADYGTKHHANISIDYDNEWFKPKILFRPSSENSHEVFHLISAELSPERDFDFSRLPKMPNAIRVVQIILTRLELFRLVKPLQKELALLQSKTVTRDNRMRVRDIKESIITERVRILNPKYKYKESEMILIQLAQQEAFAKEISTIKNGNTLPTNHWMYKHLPFIQTVEGREILRAKTRGVPDESKEAVEVEEISDEITKTTITYEKCYPIILPKGHLLTQSYILFFHEINLHGLANNVCGQIKQRFLIQHNNSYVKHVIKSKCFRCVRYNPQPQQPLMASLPDARLAHHEPPFSRVMADVAGPWKVSISRNQGVERYILLYTCLTTRALHIELLEGLDSDSTLMAFQNCFNLRGTPAQVHFDNGRNFLGMKNLYEKLSVEWNSKMMRSGKTSEPIEFIFGPARGSHFQGCVERLVGIVKSCLKRSKEYINNQKPMINDFTLRTIMNEIMNICNNRPLMIIQEEDIDILTPNSFILQRDNSQSVPYVTDKTLALRDRYKDVRAYTALLWEDWLRSYLPTILTREKWVKPADKLQVDDLVLTVDTKTANSWVLGKIILAKEGSNDQIRQVTIRLGNGSEVTRPACLVYKLAIREENSKYFN